MPADIMNELYSSILNTDISTPFYVVDKTLLRQNLDCLRDVADKSGAHILLAQKAFSMFSLYPLIAEYLNGATASGLFEARLAHEEMPAEKENHIFSPAYTEQEFPEILQICDHIIFNSISQWKRFSSLVKDSKSSFGLRINPEHSTQDHGIYDPCGFGSRLGIPASQMTPELMQGIDGLHFHTLCEQNADALEETLAAAEEKFAPYFEQIKWLNLGGGHHITRADYDRERLIQIIRRLKQKYNTRVYLEPGEAIALNCGFLVSQVVDILEHDGLNAILDTSAACHMPDILEMPYRPVILQSGPNGISQAESIEESRQQLHSPSLFTYRLGGPTCLAGDVIGSYAFDSPLTVGDKLIFCDMAIYSMVKNNTFNGIPLPSIVVREFDGSIRLIRSFGYENFKGRLS